MKPGYQTTEFWIALIAKLLSVLVALGVVSASAGASMGTAATNAVVGIGAVASLVVLARQYVESRTTLKKLALIGKKENNG